MATRIQAINAYCPKIDLLEAAEADRFMRLITQRTTLSSGVVRNVQESEVETLIGLSSTELVELWNDEHPNDPVLLQEPELAPAGR